MIVAEHQGIRYVEWAPGEPLMRTTADANRVIEACYPANAAVAILYPANLPPAFFDLSSGEAGAILQKLRTYGIRLAVVCPPGEVQFSRMFGEMAVEEARRGYFGVFETVEAARDWLQR